ncbi:MAG: right-handed parallel beta-helix repeat-containing protein, partial [Candidatus Zixiibacteriota bacterium]
MEVGFITDRQYNFIMNNHPTEPEDWFNQGAYMLFYEWTSGGNWSFAQIQDYQGEGSSVSLTWVSSYNFKVVFKPNLGGAGGTADLYMNGVLVEKDHVYGTPQTPGWWSAYDTTGEEDFTQAHLIVQLWASVSGKTVSYSNLSAQSIAEYNSTFEIDVANHLPDKVTNAQIRTGVTAGETDDAKLVVSIPSGFQFSEPSGVPANTVVGDGYSEEDPSHLFTLKTTGTQNHWVMYSSIHGPVATVNVYPNDSLVYNYGDDGNLTQEFTWHLLLTLYGSLPPYGNVIQNPSAIGDYVFDATFHSEAGQVTTVHDTVTISQPSEVWVDDDFTPSTPGWGYDHFDKVQDGIDAVAAGGTVNVLAGTYTEQITIDKSLILLGAGQYSTTIKAQLADRPGIVTEGGSIWDYIVAAYPSSASIDVKIQGFTIDANGENKSIGADRFAGVFFRDVDGTDAGLYSCTIKNFGNNLYQNWGIWVCGASDLIIDGNTLSDYTRDGIVVNGDAGPATDPSVVISNNYLTGSALPLNGIQIGRGATGTISGNTVKDHTRSSPWAAVGILIYASDGITINGGNTVENCFYGIHLEQSSGSLVSGNELMKNIAFHIGLSQSNNNQVSGNTITGTTAGTEDKAISLSQDATGNSIGGLTPADGNDITLATSGSGLLYVVYVQSTVGAGSNTVQYNTANGGTRFVQVDGGNTGTTTITDNTVTGTSFAGVFLNAGNAVLSRNVLTNTIRPVEFWGAMNVTILENIIDGSTFDGINCGSFTGSVTVSGNAIYNTTGKGVWNRTATPVDASGNWWGISNPTDVAGEVSTNVDYTPWLDDGTDKDPLTPGFQGDFSVVNVDDNSPQTGTTGRIQEGVDMVTASTVKVMAGTYYENIVINKALSLMGASQDSVLVYTDSSDVGIPNPELGPSFRGSQMVVVEATDVLIEGFTFNGDNPSLTPAGVVDARNGIITNYNSGNWNNLTVQNCTVKNIYLRGIYACAMSATPGDLTGIDFNHNTVNNV